MKFQALKNFRHARRGFTLTEILVVIGMIAVLAAIMFPAMSLLKARSESSKCMSNQRQIGALIGIYMTENNGMLPYSAGYNYTGQGANSWGWDNHSGPLAVSAGIGFGNTESTWFFDPKNPHLFNCPAEKNKVRTYTANTNLMGFLPGGGQRVPHSVINQQERKILITDNHTGPDGTKPTYFSDVASVGKRHGGKANALFADFHVESVEGRKLAVDLNLKK